MKENWKIFAPFLDRQEIPARTLLLPEGAVSNTMYFIEEGCLRTWINNDGKDITTQFFFEGDRISSIESFRTGQPSCLKSSDLRLIYYDLKSCEHDLGEAKTGDNSADF